MDPVSTPPDGEPLHPELTWWEAEEAWWRAENASWQDEDGEAAGEQAGGGMVQLPKEWRQAVAFSYLPDDERRDCRRRLEAACAGWEDGMDRQAVQDLTQLSLDCLVGYACARAYREQVEVGGPRERRGPGWVRHQEEAAGLASRSALAFCRDLRVLVRQEERATLIAISGATLEWWRRARETGDPRSVQDLIELGANQIAVALMCRSARRCAVGSNKTWWVILARRVVTRLIMRKMEPLGPAEAMLDEAPIGRHAPLSAQGRVIFYIQYILKTFGDAETEFLYRSPGEAIQYLRSVCRNCDRQLKRDWESAKKKGEVTEEAQAPLLDDLTLVAEGVESDLGLSPAGQDDGGATRTGKQATYLAQYWEILQNTLGRNSAVKYWLISLLRQDEFEWNTIEELFEENDCPFRYEDSLPPGITWEEVNTILAPMKKTGANLRQFWSKATRPVHAELLRRL